MKMREKVDFVKLLFWIGCVVLCFQAVEAQDTVAIMDCGSSGSRLYIYEINNEGNIKQVKDTVGGPALSSTIIDGQLQPSVIKSIEGLTACYQPEKKIPLYIMATAGMRLVEQRHARQVYDALRSDSVQLSLKGYELKFAQTVAGKYEGYYAWLSANYTGERNRPIDFSKQRGTIEFGGASMQLAFLMQTNRKPSERNLIERKGIGKVYAQSLLGGGVNVVYQTSQIYPGIRTHIYEYLALSMDYIPEYGVFYAVGKPIENVLLGAERAKVELADYASVLSDNDLEEKYHPYATAQYLCYILHRWQLDRRLEIPKTDISWTKGAAVDIIVFGMMPEVFDYKVIN